MTDNKKLEDFGEHIAGAKKETYFRAIDPTSNEAKSLPLSKLWNEKDIKAIKDIEIASIAHTLRDDLPTRPRSPHKLNRWLDDVSKSQKVVVDLLEKNDPVFTEIVMRELEKTHSGGKAYLLTKLDREDWKKVGDVRFPQDTSQNNTIYLSVQLKGERHSFYPKEPVTIKNYDTRAIIDEFASDIQTILKDKAIGTREMTASSFDIYTRTKDKTAFICAKTDRQKTPLIEFETLAEAREYKKDPENITELSRRWTAHREHNSITKTDMRNAVNEERTGQSYRDHDITPDEFMATFGVRGGQFGNWVTGDERQQMLNNAYDGFMDLSKALKIDPKAIGLNGTLGIAFGARGSGWASAHYERGEQVINLTKTRGAGSLAHEWWHALDHYMKNGDDLLTRHLNANSTARHQELIAPVRELVKDIHKSELYSRSQKADAYRSQPYFSTDVEMTARAFEGHIQHTLSTMGIKNDFLVNIKAEKDWQKNLDAYPYPKAEELELLGKAYNTVFDTLKEADKEFVPVHYEPEQIIHADTLAVTEAEKTKENQPFALDTYLQNNGFTQDIHGIWQKEVSGYDEKLMIFGYPNSSLDIRLGDNRSTLIAKMDENISLEEVHQTFTESWYSDLVEWRLDNEKTQDNLEQEHAKQSLNTANEPQAQTVGEATPIQQPQELPSAVNKILINNYLENNGFEKGINVGSYRKQIDDNNLLVVGVANDVSIQSVANNQAKEQETVLSSLTQNLSEDDIKQAFSQSKLWQVHLGQSVQPTIQAEQPTQPTPVAQQQQATAYTPNISQYDTKLNTPYAEKNQAKALGAKWDNVNKTWYAPAGLDLNKFEKWLVQDRQISQSNNTPNQKPQQGRLGFVQPTDRLYLHTKPSDNDKMQELKAQGIIKFDLTHKLWFTHKDNTDIVRQWATRPNVPTPEQALKEHLESMGVVVPTGHPIFDEQSHRLSNQGSTDKNVMYHAYANPNGVPYCAITNFSRNGTSTWTYPTEYLHDLRTIEAVERAMGQSYANRPTPAHQTQNGANAHHTTANLTQSKPQTPRQAVKSEAEIALENQKAELAKMMMSFAPLANAEPNTYLDRKQVGNNGVVRVVPSSNHLPKELEPYIAIGNTPKQEFYLRSNNPENKLVLRRGSLIIPQYNAQGELRAFETIAYNGSKYALKDAEKSGLSTQLGNLKDGNPVIITEGYATGATLHEHTGRAVVVAFGKNGLMDIAQELREKYPNSKIYIGADNDHNKEQNYGLQNATAVVKAVDNVHILTPKFEQGDTGKDWNDILVDKGVGELKRQIKEQLALINPQQANKTTENQPNQAIPAKQSKDLLDPDIIRQNYPTMSDDTIKAVQAWRAYINEHHANDPQKQELNLLRLTNALPDFANGKELPLPKSKAVEQRPPTPEPANPQPAQPSSPEPNGGVGR